MQIDRDHTYVPVHTQADEMSEEAPYQPKVEQHYGHQSQNYVYPQHLYEGQGHQTFYSQQQHFEEQFYNNHQPVQDHPQHFQHSPERFSEPLSSFSRLMMTPKATQRPPMTPKATPRLPVSSAPSSRP